MTEVQAREERLAEAIRSADRGAADKLLADDFVLTSSLGTGLRVERSQWLETLVELETEAIGFRDFESRRVGSADIAVFLMDFRARWGDDDLTGPYVVTDVWEDGRLSWRSWARLNATFLQEPV